ncbi:TPA: hypothetical protein ACKP6X_006615 [Pseudomonas aeruginosa]
MANTTVVLFEKPDQARKHGAFMGIAQQNRGYLVAKNGWILTHAIGHLVNFTICINLSTPTSPHG